MIWFVIFKSILRRLCWFLMCWSTHQTDVVVYSDEGQSNWSEFRAECKLMAW